MAYTIYSKYIAPCGHVGSTPTAGTEKSGSRLTFSFSTLCGSLSFRCRKINRFHDDEIPISNFLNEYRPIDSELLCNRIESL